MANRAVNDFAHVRFITKHKRHVEHIDLVHHRAHGTDRNAGNLQGTNLGLLNHFLLAAQLHGGEHLNGDAAIGGGFELFAHAHDGFHCGITHRVHIGGFQHHFALGLGLKPKRRGPDGQAGCDPFDELSFFHGLSPVLKKDGGGKINAG